MIANGWIAIHDRFLLCFHHGTLCGVRRDAVESPEGAAFMPTPMLFMALSVTGVCATGAFAIPMWVQKTVSAQRVALIFSLEPAYAAWLAWYFLGERLDAGGWIGSALILTAVVRGSIGKDTV